MSIRLSLALSFLALLFGVGCSTAPPRCLPSNCAGCCDTKGECVIAPSIQACGLRGSACVLCSGAQLCIGGLCSGTAAGGGGGETGGGTGGGGTGGGTGGGVTGGGTGGGATGGGTGGGTTGGGTGGGVTGGGTGGGVTGGGTGGGATGGGTGGGATGGGTGGGATGGGTGGGATGGGTGGGATGGGTGGGTTGGGGGSTGGGAGGGGSTGGGGGGLVCSPALVISALYGGGGNTGATYSYDFVELKNRTSGPIDLTGWSVQYGASAGTNWALVIPLTGTVPAHGYFLLRGAIGATVTNIPLPTAFDQDAPTLAIGQSNGVVALVNSLNALTACPAAGTVADFVGYGTATCRETASTGALSPTLAAYRALNGCTDTNSNAADLTASPLVAPRNTSSATSVCTCP